jgi:dGTPase
MMNWEKLLSSGRFQQKPQAENLLNSYRTEFERDYDRIIFSAPFRNLQDKTQVFPLPEHDFVHTRLTHSLEVSSVGRSLGKNCGEFLLSKYPNLSKLGINPSDVGAIVAAAALSHDIGNPPFGHAGEEAISDFFKFHPSGYVWKEFVSPQEWADLSNFEGNAQGFRMLTAKNNGLKLSFVTLATFTKYPRPSLLSATDKSRKSQKKYGFFADQKETYQELADILGLKSLAEDSWLRHPLTFLVEAADDICYSIIDLEDGCTLGLVSLAESIDLMAEIIGEKFDSKKLEEYTESSQKLAILRAMAIGELINQTVKAFEENEEKMLMGEFDQALTDILPSSLALQKISKLSVKKIYRSKPVLEKEAAGYQVLEGLLDVFSNALYHHFYETEKYSGKDKSLLRLMPEGFPLVGYEKGVNPYPLLRSLIDFISGMTDKHALSLYRRVKGISLPGV